MRMPYQKVKLNPGQKGDAEICRIVIEPTNLRAVLHDCIPPGEYSQLKINGEIFMSDTPMEQNTNLQIYDMAHGDVLIGGLGLGMILSALVNKSEVQSISVIENNENVIDLVWTQLQNEPNMKKVTIIQGDVFKSRDLFMNKKFDVIYMDVWNYINTKVFKEMEQLKLYYKKLLKHSKFDEVICWCYLNAKYGIKPTASL